MAGRPIDAELRFWNLVNGPWCDETLDPYDDCWIWMGGTCTSRRPKSLPVNKPWKRYGRFHLNMETGLVNSHRAALILTVGQPADEGLVAAHGCDNGLCCHPGHLKWETQAENMQEALGRNRLTRIPNENGRGERYASTGIYG